MTGDIVRIQRRNWHAASWEAALNELEQEGLALRPRDMFLYEESVSSCGFERRVLGDFRPRSDTWEGRIFDDELELRWRRTGDELIDLHLVREMDSGGGRPDTLEVKVTARRTYLIGTLDPESGVYREGRYPRWSSDHAGVGRAGGEVGDRAFVVVHEYRHEMPVWSGIEEPARVAALLAEPLLVEHRFVRLESGREG